LLLVALLAAAVGECKMEEGLTTENKIIIITYRYNRKTFSASPLLREISTVESFFLFPFTTFYQL